MRKEFMDAWQKVLEALFAFVLLCVLSRSGLGRHGFYSMTGRSEGEAHS